MEMHQVLMVFATSAAVGLCMLAFFQRHSFTAALRRLLLAGLLVLAILLTVGSDRGVELVYQYATSVRIPVLPP